MNRGARSSPDRAGGFIHYDDRGKVIGRSRPDRAGGFTEYDANGKKIGRSSPDRAGGFTHYDDRGKRIGRSSPDRAGGFYHYDANNKSIGHSGGNRAGGYHNDFKKGFIEENKKSNSKSSSKNSANLFDLSSGASSSSGGCYIATCVYGSYDCPEVWTLRRFRDYFLCRHVVGRLFVKAYYAVSPQLVRMFGNQSWFHIFWKRFLDNMVECLENRGFSDKPYNDEGKYDG